MIATTDTRRCSPEEWEEFRCLVSNGMLFEVIEWIDQGKATLRPENKKTSAFAVAVLAPNLSMVRVLWERGWQDRVEVVRALGSVAWERNSLIMMRYLLEQGCPVDQVTGYDLCLFHDLGLVRLGMSRGVSILEPDGWASAFISAGSRPLIRLYLEERDRIPGLQRDAVLALCECIKESRLRAVGLLKWAGVDPLGPAPRYGSWADPEDDWCGFPALRLCDAKKANEILKLLKLKPTDAQWFDLVERAASAWSEILEDILALRRDPSGTLRASPDRATALLRSLLRSLCWSWGRYFERDQRIVDFCQRLLAMGVQLWWDEDDGMASFRRYLYRSEQKNLVFKVLSRAAEVAEDRSRADRVELVRPPKMRELVISHDAMILRHLGLSGPADYDPPPVRRQPVPVPAQAAQGPRPRDVQAAPLPRPVTDPVPTKQKPPRGHMLAYPKGKVLTRSHVYEAVWSKPVMHVAKEYGISGSMLARICTHLNIPRPPRGYWARPAKARPRKPSLPKWTGAGEGTWSINPINIRAQLVVPRE